MITVRIQIINLRWTLKKMVTIINFIIDCWKYVKWLVHQMTITRVLITLRPYRIIMLAYIIIRNSHSVFQNTLSPHSSFEYSTTTVATSLMLSSVAFFKTTVAVRKSRAITITRELFEMSLTGCTASWCKGRWIVKWLQYDYCHVEKMLFFTWNCIHLDCTNDRVDEIESRTSTCIKGDSWCPT